MSDVGTLSTLITPGTKSGTTDPAAGTSGKSADPESAPNKPGKTAEEQNINTCFLRTFCHKYLRNLF